MHFKLRSLLLGASLLLVGLAGGQPLAAVDHDGDGNADVAFLRPGSGWSTVPVLLSNGDGTWRSTNNAVPDWANQPGVVGIDGDYNGDRRADIALHRPGGGWNSVPVLFSEASGAWRVTNSPVPDWANEPDVIAIPGDYNRDGRGDLALHRPGAGWTTIPVLFSNGDGTWRATNSGVPVWTSDAAVIALAGDYNQDGRTDLAFHRPGSNWSTVPVLFSNGDGTWRSTNAAAPTWANDVGVMAITGDHNRDGRTDIAFHRPGSGWSTLPVLIANGDGTWRSTNTAAPEWASQSGVIAISADFNQDQRADVAFHRPGSTWNTVPVLFSNGDGTWRGVNGGAPEWANQPGVIAIPGDYNRDGRADIAFHRPGSSWNTVPVLFSNGDGTWRAVNGGAPEWANQPGVQAIGAPLPAALGRSQSALVNAAQVSAAPCSAVVFLNSSIRPSLPPQFNCKGTARLAAGTATNCGCSGTFIHPRFILTAAHCLRRCSTSNDIACWDGEPDAPWDGSSWAGRDGTILSPNTLTANDGLNAGVGANYSVDFVFFPRPEHFPGTPLPDVAILRTTTPFTGGMAGTLPMMEFQDLVTPDNLSRRYELTWPSLVGYSGNPNPAGLATTSLTRRIGRSKGVCDVEAAGRAFKVDGHGRAMPGARVCSGDSGGPVVWEDGFGGNLVSGVLSFGDNYRAFSDTRCPSERGESGIAFVPRAFLDSVARRDSICNSDWHTCARPKPSYGGRSLRYLGTEIDQCSSPELHLSGSQGTVSVSPGATRGVPLSGSVIDWTCGGSPGVTHAPASTRFVVVRRSIGNREIKWDAYADGTTTPPPGPCPILRPICCTPGPGDACFVCIPIGASCP